MDKKPCESCHEEPMEVAFGPGYTVRECLTCGTKRLYDLRHNLLHVFETDDKWDKALRELQAEHPEQHQGMLTS